MGETQKGPGTANLLLLGASLVIIIAGMRAAEAILVPFLLSIFIAVISAPPLFWLRQRGIPTLPALLIVVAGILAIGSVMGVLVGASVNDFSRSLPTYQARLKSEEAATLAWLAELGIHLPKGGLLKLFDPGAAMQMAAKMLSSFGGVLTNAFLILLTVVFILLEASSFPAKVRAAWDHPEAAFEGFDRFIRDLNRYMEIKTWISLVTGAAVAALMALLRVDYPILWGLLAFLFNYVPNIGSIIAAVPAVLLAFIQHGISRALLAALAFLLVNVVMGNIIEPRFMGKGLGLSTLVVFLSLVFWGWVLGPVGMFLSVPLTMTAKIALDRQEDTRWLAVLLGTDGGAAATVSEKEA